MDSTADKILSATPEKVFIKPDKDIIEKKYKDLVKIWHPDISRDPKANDVTAHLGFLKKAALEKVDKGIWEEDGVVTFYGNDSKIYRVRFIKNGKFELGRYFIGNKIVAYEVGGEHRNLFENAKKTISNFKFRSKRMEEEMMRFLPKIIKTFETVNGFFVMVIEKSKDMICLKDVLDYLGGEIDPKHVAWIMSSLHNLMCYFELEGITHNDISLENYFIMPGDHNGALLGGWWYARKAGENLVSVPKRTYNIMTRKQKESKRADTYLNLQLIRLLGLEILGDSNGVKLAKSKKVPMPMLNWLRQPATGDAISDYKTWQDKILLDSFGKRKYNVFDVDAKSVYS